MTVKATGEPVSGAPGAAVKVSVALEPAVMLAGTNDPVTPVGRSCTLRVMFSALPAVSAVLTVYAISVAGKIDCDPGVADAEKLFAAQFGNLTLAMRVSHVAAPVVLYSSFVYQNVQSSAGSIDITL